ncbi:Na(+)/H(+) antiporter subunit C [Xylanibacillus composti]|uniref:Na(+)/H(+) antiporter subunit C n=1 Tax=Xylanibacillus composti TaxID=1572762 RepID=A0A8J4H3R6_9BACL|nr:Na(+)/H(+) antiporter subunit C [Xylanibacillus composti]MDT9725339.1 Na(+)/H(+) antiporter subunit C [Xylanibacillus composti]GIQ69100.1 Na(+)/H(+) antiporter subunit C [Xylanibacillus composti]
METFMTIIAGILFTVGTYLALSKSLLRIILGTAIFAHATHLMLLTIAGLKQGAAPLLGEQSGTYTDPLPQALILTSIVISFALTAYFLVLGYRAYIELGTDDMDKLRGEEHE